MNRPFNRSIAISSALFAKLRKAETVIASNFNVVTVFIFLFFLMLSLLRINRYTLDETVFHYPNFLNFYENGWEATFNEKYSAANTPLPYIIVATLAKFFGPSLALARITTALISFFTLLLVVKLLDFRKVPHSQSIGFLFLPYFFVNAFVFYAVNYGLFFLVMGMNFWKDSLIIASKRKELLAGIFFSLAVLCQQFYVLAPIGIVVYKLIRLIAQKGYTNRKLIGRELAAASLLTIPLLIPFLLFFTWGGITHPNFSSHSLGFYPTTIVAVLFVLGFYFFPYLLLSAKRISVKEAIAAICVAVPLVWKFSPEFSEFQGPGKFTGLVFHLITLFGKIHYSLVPLVMSVLVGAGLLVMVRLIQNLHTVFEYTIALIAGLLFLSYCVNTQIGERHLSGMMLLLFLLLIPGIRKAGLFYSAFISLLGISYFFYWYFIKFS